MHPDELAYYRERALMERQRASDPTISNTAAEIHLKLAGLYEMLVELEENDNPTIRIVEVGHPAESGSPQSLARAPRKESGLLRRAPQQTGRPRTSAFR
jgi:hypothetical protein